MQDSLDILEAVKEDFCSDGYYFENIRFEIPDGLFKTIKRDYELIVFNSKKVIFFARMPEGSGEALAVATIRAALNCLVSKLSVSLSSVIPCGINDTSLFYLNKYNDRLSVFENEAAGAVRLLDILGNEAQFGPDVFSYDFMKQMSDALVLASGAKDYKQKQPKIKTSADGTLYLRKHGIWREASEIDTDTFYAITALTGMFGGHHFYQRKPGKGFLYLLTLGLFGFGWFFDCFEIFVGIYKDATRRYLLPLSNKVLGIILFLVGLVLLCLAALLLSFVYKFLLGALTELVTSLV